MSRFKKLVLSLILALALALPTVGLVGCEFSLGGGSGQTTSQTDANNQNNNNNNNNGNQNQTVLTFEKVTEDLAGAYNKAEKTIVDIYNNAALEGKDLYANCPTPEDPEHPTEEEQSALNEYNDAMDILDNKQNAVYNFLDNNTLSYLLNCFLPNYTPSKMENGAVYADGSQIAKYVATANDAYYIEYCGNNNSEDYGHYYLYNYKYENGELSKLIYSNYQFGEAEGHTNEIFYINLLVFDVKNMAVYTLEGQCTENFMPRVSSDEQDNLVNYLDVLINNYNSGNITGDFISNLYDNGKVDMGIGYYSLSELKYYFSSLGNYGHSEDAAYDDQTNVADTTESFFGPEFPTVEEPKEISFIDMLVKLYRANFSFNVEKLTYNLFDLNIVDDDNPIWFTNDEYDEFYDNFYSMMDNYMPVNYYDEELDYNYTQLWLQNEILNAEKLENIISGLIEWLSDDDNEGYTSTAAETMSKEDFITGLENALVNLADEERFSGTINFSTEGEEGLILYFDGLNTDGSMYAYHFVNDSWSVWVGLENDTVVRVNIEVYSN